MPNVLPHPHAELDPEIADQSPDPSEILKVLESYRSEAEQGRLGGPAPRDDVWRANWDRYWGNYDRTNKAAWQSKHVMPEVPQFVDRWAAAMREALEAAGDFFTVVDPGEQAEDLIPHVIKVMRMLLRKCAMTADGHRVDFTSVFEDQMKMGAIMALCASVTWKEGRHGGYVAVDTVDPREVWYDPQNRNLYRRRRYELDKHELLAMAQEAPDLYDLEQIEMLEAGVRDEAQEAEKERSSGHGSGEGGATGRKEIQIDEWLCDLIMPDGTVAASNSLVVVANDRFIIRGPEPNPWRHGCDWLVFTPMVSVPMSVYGRTYMEDWADVADAFIELTNLIIDGVFTSTLKAFAAKPDMLVDPTQLNEGLSPNVVFLLDDIARSPDQFLGEIDLGTLPADSFQVWQALKQEIREGAKLSEIALGQAAPHARTTAHEIQQVQQAGSAMIRSMARTIESRFLEPVLNLVWKTALQEMDFAAHASEIGKETADMLDARRDEFLEYGLSFEVRGISAIIDRQSKLQNLLSFLQIAAQNEILMQHLLQIMDPRELLMELFELFGLDPDDFKPSERELMMRQMTGPQVPPQQAGQPAPGGPSGPTP